MTSSHGAATDGVTRVDLGAEEVETTKAERLLALVLAVFVLIGLLWAYAQPLDRTDRGGGGVAVSQPFDERGNPLPDTALTPQQRALVQYERAVEVESRAGFALQTAEEAEVRAREAYRTELDAGRAATEEERLYRAAQATTERAATALAAAAAAREALEPAYDQAQAQLQEQADRDRWVTFLLRLAWVVAALVLGLLWLDRMRRRRSRWQPLGASVVAAATVQALVMAGDYLGITDLAELGPLVLSLLGVAVTVAAFVAYQRWLARRLTPRRVRRQECPYCGHPAATGAHCVGCGRSVLAPCVGCGEARRVGSRFCAACGASGTERTLAGSPG